MYTGSLIGSSPSTCRRSKLRNNFNRQLAANPESRTSVQRSEEAIPVQATPQGTADATEGPEAAAGRPLVRNGLRVREVRAAEDA